MTTQNKFYQTMMDYTLSDNWEGPAADYYLVDTIKGIEYYTPNDEDWGAIVAVCHVHKLAQDTGFFEMDDMEGEDSDYAFSVHNNELVSAYEIN